MSDTIETTPPTEITDATPPPAAPPAAPPPAPKATPKAAPKSSDPREVERKLDQWRATLDRKDKSNQRKLDEVHQGRRQLEEERKAHAEKLAKIEQYERQFARLKAGDMDAFKEIAGDDGYDKLTRAQLDPETTRQQAEIRKALEQRDSEIAALKKEIADWKQQQQDQQVQAERQRQAEVFIATARGRDADELSIYDDGELISLANHFGPALARDLGRDPTMSEVIDAIAEHEARPRFERLKGRGYAKGGAAPPPAKKSEEPTTITAADATAPTGEAPRAPRSAREERERTLREMTEQWKQGAKKGAA